MDVNVFILTLKKILGLKNATLCSMTIQKYKPARMNPRLNDSVGRAGDANMSDSIEMPGSKKKHKRSRFFIYAIRPGVTAIWLFLFALLCSYLPS